MVEREIGEVVRAREDQADRDRLDPQHEPGGEAERRERGERPREPAAPRRPRPPGRRRRPRARAPTRRPALCAHGSGRAPVCRHLLERLRERLVLAPLDDGDAERAELEPGRAPAQLPEPERDSSAARRPGCANGTGETSTTARSKPRARRSSSAPTARSSSSGVSASTSAFGGSVRAGMTSMSFHA